MTFLASAQLDKGAESICDVKVCTGQNLLLPVFVLQIKNAVLF
jgi:hypothetical protein